MEPHDPPEDIDQTIRINELRETARELSDGEMTSWEIEDAPPEITEQFWKNVVAFEQAGETCHFKQLTDRGVEIPEPKELNDTQLTEKLWEVIHQLAKLGVFLSSTNHLSDRELYSLLYEDLLREITADLPPEMGWVTHLDILGSGSEEDVYLYNKYYADDQEREQSRRDFPEYEMPDHVDPAYDRDSRLPTSSE